MTHWLTANALTEAEALVDADIAQADRTLAEVDASRRQREEAEAETWREFASSPSAPAEWRRVLERVENGELTWTDLAGGRLWDDPDVAAAVAASRPASPSAVPALPADLDEELEDSPLRRD